MLRDALLLAFANLSSYGIDARPAFGASRQGGAAAILEDRRARYPHAIDSWVLWTKPDDQAFGADGELTRPLMLHCSGHDVVSAVLAACIQEGIITEAADSIAGPIVRVHPHDPAK